jgi:hypothetical protein
MREQLLKRRAGNLRSTLKASNDKQQKLELEWLKLRMRPRSNNALSTASNTVRVKVVAL